MTHGMKIAIWIVLLTLIVMLGPVAWGIGALVLLFLGLRNIGIVLTRSNKEARERMEQRRMRLREDN